MERCWYFVIETRGKWWVDSEGHILGPFDDAASATTGAIQVAETFGDPDRRLIVLAPTEPGRIGIAWQRNAIVPPAEK
jgi:hypothetical protein